LKTVLKILKPLSGGFGLNTFGYSVHSSDLIKFNLLSPGSTANPAMEYQGEEDMTTLDQDK
jgi:hypothetical protein